VSVLFEKTTTTYDSFVYLYKHPELSGKDNTPLSGATNAEVE